MRRKLLVAALFAVTLLNFGRHREAVVAQASPVRQQVHASSDDIEGKFDVRAFVLLAGIAGVVVGILVKTSKA